MSGHSHFATIKRAKEANDSARGKVFSKHSKSIAIAIKSGGNADPEMNSKLRFAIEQAKSDNMPKVNIDRILERANEVKNIEEVTYEGFGPDGVNVIVLAATDNKNRTSQEIKNLFEKSGGNMAGPGAVAFNFDQVGLVVVKKGEDAEEQILKVIDVPGVVDVEDVGEELEVFTQYERLSEVKDALVTLSFEVTSFAIVMRPKTLMTITSPEKAKKIMSLVDTLDEYDDVQNVFTNVDISDEIASQINE
jgi:YebC/PmpR family DNA-binding regulatory protein